MEVDLVNFAFFIGLILGCFFKVFETFIFLSLQIILLTIYTIRVDRATCQVKYVFLMHLLTKAE